MKVRPHQLTHGQSALFKMEGNRPLVWAFTLCPMKPHVVRNIFDQYTQPENRLTHALAQVLSGSQRLIRDFVRFAVGVEPPKGILVLNCQAFPGERQISLDDEEAERLGVPDIWIWHASGEWAVLCECKLTATTTAWQLERHKAQARRRGFRTIHLLVISAEDSRSSALPERVKGVPVAWTSWARLFRFLSTSSRDALTVQFLTYMRIVEGQLMARKGYDGPPLTTFTGVPFGPGHPYTRAEATVLLRALMAEFRNRLQKSPVLPVEISIRRPAIALRPWDIVGFKFADPQRSFNKYPHLTVGIDDEKVGLALTLPAQDVSGSWLRLRTASVDQQTETLREVGRRVRPIRRRAARDIWEPKVFLDLFQRHFYAQRYSTLDGQIKFDLDTVVGNVGKTHGRTKALPAWLAAFHSVLEKTPHANFEFQLRAEWPLIDGSVARRADLVGSLISAAEAFRPFLTLLVGKLASRKQRGRNK